MTDAMRLEVRPFGIQAVLIEPGTIDSSFLRTSESLNATTFTREGSPYAALYARFRELANQSRYRGAKPKQVSRVILRAMRAKHPRQRYLAAVSVLYRLTLRAGDNRRDWLMGRVFRIPSYPAPR